MRGDWIINGSQAIKITSHNRDSGKFKGRGEGEPFIVYGKVEASDTTLDGRRLAVVWMRVFIGPSIFCKYNPNSSYHFGRTYSHTEAYYIYAAREIVPVKGDPYSAFSDKGARYRNRCNAVRSGGLVGNKTPVSLVRVRPPEVTVTEPEDGLYQVGDSGPAGGVVFYVSDDGLHGMEAAAEDQVVPRDAGYGAPDGAEWGCELTEIAGATGTAIGTGEQNTADILAGCMDTPIAADVASAYSVNGFSDWFLPSIDELSEMEKVVSLGAISGYWSSSQVDSNSAWMLLSGSYASSSSLHIIDKHNLKKIRAVRAF